MNKNNIMNKLFDFVLINFGLMLLSIAVVLFLTPSNISSGGATGMATIMHYYFNGINVGTLLFIINIPLFLMGVFTFGKSFALNTFYGISAMSIMCNVISSVNIDMLNDIKVMSESNLILATIMGGILVGLGVGISLAFGGTSGGTTIPAQVLNHKFNMPIGISMVIVDFSIVLFGGFAFGFGSMLYASIALVISGKVVDCVVDYAKSNKNILKLRGITS